MTADDAALYDERDDALLRAERAEIELEDAQRTIEALSKSNGRLYGRWHAAATRLRIAEAEIEELGMYVTGVKRAEAKIRDQIANALARLAGELDGHPQQAYVDGVHRAEREARNAPLDGDKFDPVKHFLRNARP